MEQNPIEFIKEKIELDGDTDFLHINWDKFYDIIEQAYLMDIKRMESLKDFNSIVRGTQLIRVLHLMNTLLYMLLQCQWRLSDCEI